MIFLRLESDLRVRIRGSKYDTCQNHACILCRDHTGRNVGLHAI